MDDRLTVRSELLGNELKQARERENLTLMDAAAVIGSSISKMSRVESGTRTITAEDVSALCGRYGVDRADRALLIDLAHHATEATWLITGDYALGQRALTFMEGRAHKIVEYQAGYIPGLLQTGEYIRALMRSIRLLPEAVIEQRLMDRVERQRMLRASGRPEYTAIIEQSALNRRYGGRDVLRRQLEHLVEAACRLDVGLRVVPADVADHPGFDGLFTVWNIRGRAPVVYAENRQYWLFMEEAADVASYTATLAMLDEVALSTTESVHLIANMAVELE